MIQILTTYYNSSNWVHRCIDSLQKQDIKDWKCWITDDLSTDGGVDLITELTKKDNRFVLIKNEKKYWQVGNYFQIIEKSDINDEDLIITVDSDDWLPDNLVFDRVSDAYSDNNTWITYGSFASYMGDDKLVNEQWGKHDNLDMVRWTSWKTSHLRTWKAWLFRKIQKQDLLDPVTNWYWDAAGDLPIMFPMLEISSNEHSKYLPDINYIYNCTNSLSEGKIMLDKIHRNEGLIRKMPKYKKLEKR